MIIIYSKTDGRIKRWLSIPPNEIGINMDAERESYIESDCVGDATHVVNGKLVKKDDRTSEDRLTEIRMERDALLFQADIINCNAEKWSTMTPEQQQAWRTYKQELRDFPAVCNADNPMWPKPPA